MFEILTLGATIIGGLSAKNSADKAAAAAARVGEFNAGLIERDIDLLEKQREIINRNAVLQERVDRFRFREAQGSVVAQYSGAGIDISHGTPMRVMRQAAREFEYDQAVNDFNIDVSESVLIGDKYTDIQAGQNAGVGTNILYIGAHGLQPDLELVCHSVSTLNEAKFLL